MSSSTTALLTILSISLLLGCSRRPKATPAELEAAAQGCEVLVFRDHMPPAAFSAAEKTSAEIAEVQRSLDEVFNLAKRKFGDKVSRERDELRFVIDPKDARWDRIFGPQWATLKNAPAPHYFRLKASYNWNQECEVLRRFQACLASRGPCEETSVAGSQLQMTKAGGTYHLDGKDLAAQKDNRERTLTFLKKTLRDSRDFLKSDAAKGSHEDVLVELASRYFAGLRKFMTSMLRSAARPKNQALQSLPAAEP